MDVWNSDTDYHTTPETGYKSVPMYWSSLGYGVYLHNWQPSTFNLGGTDAGKIQITASGGEMDFYLFGGPTFADIAGQYTALTGRPAMLPKWALGYHQGGAGNDPTLNWASGVASQMRQNQLPLDAVYYDDWDASYFTPAAVGSLKDQYHIQITAGLGMPYSAAGSDLWNALAQLSPKGMLCDAEGTPLQYCANGFENPVTDFDFFNSAACDEIFNQIWKGPLDAGVWNGMSDFGELDYVPNPTQAFFPSFQNPARSAYELHNLYGLQYFMSMTQRAADYKDSRLIGMTRPGTAGSQRYGWTWTGDSDTSYNGVNGFQAHLRGVLNLTMSGFSNVGFDIGGWDGVSDDALFARWFQAGMFNPYAAVMDVCRDALELRYSLLPYTYSLMYQAHQTGVPIQRALAFETNCESGTEDLWDEFFYGPSLLAAPVVRDSTVKNVYLPSGTWIDYWDGKAAYSGRRRNSPKPDSRPASPLPAGQCPGQELLRHHRPPLLPLHGRGQPGRYNLDPHRPKGQRRPVHCSGRPVRPGRDRPVPSRHCGGKQLLLGKLRPHQRPSGHWPACRIISQKKGDLTYEPSAPDRRKSALPL